MRWLIWHPESESLFEEHDPEKLDALFGGQCEDVTGIASYESKYQIQKELEMEYKLTQHQPNHDAFYREMIARQVFSSCINCINFSKPKDKPAICLLYKVTPPPEVIVFSCGAAYEGDLPF